MKYGITENHRFVLIDDDRQRLINTLAFVPQYTEDRIGSYPDDEVEQDHQGNWYEKGHAPKKSLAEAKAEKMMALNDAFIKAFECAHCPSSAGFEINADEVANRNIEGLLLTLEPGEKILFRAYDNRFHEVTREQIENMQKDIFRYVQRLYRLKWKLEATIDKAQSMEVLAGIEMNFDETEAGPD